MDMVNNYIYSSVMAALLRIQCAIKGTRFQLKPVSVLGPYSCQGHSVSQSIQKTSISVHIHSLIKTKVILERLGAVSFIIWSLSQ